MFVFHNGMMLAEPGLQLNGYFFVFKFWTLEKSGCSVYGNKTSECKCKEIVMDTHDYHKL